MKKEIKLSLDHPRDRKVRMLHKKEKREQRLSAQKTKLDYERNMNYLRAAWFREQCITLAYTKTPIPKDILTALVLLFIHRNDEEIKELQSERNLKYGRIRQLEAVRESELDAVKSAKGLLIPRLESEKDVELLTMVWDGLPETLSVVHMKGFSTDDLSRFNSQMESLRNKIESIFIIRQSALSSLKNKFKRKTKQINSKHLYTNSVKKVDSSTESVKSKVRVNLARQQQRRQTQARRDALLQRRDINTNEQEKKEKIEQLQKNIN